MKLREEHGVSYQRCFPGYLLIDWLLQNGDVESRCQGLELCRALLEHGIIQHGETWQTFEPQNNQHYQLTTCPPFLFLFQVTKKHDFFDSGLLYQFCINFRRRRRLSELLNEGKQDNEEGASTSQEDSLDSPFILRRSPPSEHTPFQSGIQIWELFEHSPLLLILNSALFESVTKLQCGKVKTWNRSPAHVEAAWMPFSFTVQVFLPLDSCLLLLWDVIPNQASWVLHVFK